MALINEWILKDNLKDTVGGKDLVTFGTGQAQFKDKSIYLDGTYALKTSTAYPLPISYTLSIIVNANELTDNVGTSLIFGNGNGQSYIGSAVQGITQWTNGMYGYMTGAGDGYTQHIAKIPINTRLHFVMTVSEGKVLNYYIDAVPIRKSVSIVSATKNNPLTIGAYSNAPATFAGFTNAFFKANVQNARIYDHALSEQEVVDLYEYYLVKNKSLIFHDGSYKNWYAPVVQANGSIVPTMTSNTLPAPFVASSSSMMSNYHPYYAFNKTNTDSNICWIPATTANEWIMLKLDSPKRISKVKITSNFGVNPTSAPKNFIVQGSNDGSSFVDIKEFNDTTAWSVNQTKDYELGFISEPYLYYRLYVKSNAGFSSYISIGELDFTLESDSTEGGSWRVVSTTLPTSTHFLEEGMDELSPLLNRKITDLSPTPMEDKTSTLLGSGATGKAFSKKIDLKKLIDLRSIRTEVK